MCASSVLINQASIDWKHLCRHNEIPQSWKDLKRYLRVSGLRVRHTLYPSIYVTYRYGIPMRMRVFPVYSKETLHGIYEREESYSDRTGSSMYRARSDVSESYLGTV